MKKPRGGQYLKILICSSLMAAASIGLCFYSAGVYYQPMSGALHISVGTASTMTMWMLVLMAVATLAVPFLLQKAGLRLVLLSGTILCAGGTLFMAFSLNALWMQICAAIQGLGAAGIGLVPATTLINNWYNEKKSWTTSLALCAPAIAAAIFSPLLTLVINSLSVRMALVTQAILIVLLMLPALIWPISLTPQAAGEMPYGQAAPRKAAGHTGKKVAFILAAIALLSALLIALPEYFPSLCASIGQSTLLGAGMMSAAMLGNVVFKLAGGILSERYKPVLASGILDLIAAAGTIGLLICVFAPQDMALRILSFFYGAVYALNELGLPLLVSSQYGKKQYAFIYGLISSCSLIATAICIPLLGRWYEAAHGFQWILAGAIGVEVLIVLLVWMLLTSEKDREFVQNERSARIVGHVNEMARNYRQAREAKAALKKQQAAPDNPARAVQQESEPAETIRTVEVSRPDAPDFDKQALHQAVLQDDNGNVQQSHLYDNSEANLHDPIQVMKEADASSEHQ